MAIERSQIQFGRTRIHYAIQRSDKRATVAIAVDPREGVLLTAPADISVERLDRVVHDKARWIVDKLQKQRHLHPPLPMRTFVSGETFLYLGRQYRLRIEPDHRDEEAEEVGLRRGWLVVSIPEALKGAERAERVRGALVAWYTAHAAERLPERATIWANKLEVPIPQVLIREPRKRWGSCDARGTLRFSWRVIQAPIQLVDYVVAHELVHLQHADHTRAFWATLGRAMPDYDARKETLRRIGPALTW